MIDDSPRAVKAIEEMVDWISSKDGLPDCIKYSIVAKALRYLRAINGNLDASLGVFDDSGLDDHDAESEVIDDLTKRNPRGEFYSAKAVLERYGQDRGWGIPRMEKGGSCDLTLLHKIQDSTKDK
jgi:hypothetical protein